MIDERAIIDPSASIADDVTIGPFTIIGPKVEIDSGTWVGPHAVIKGPTRIGKNNRIYQFASLGEDAQDKKYAGEETWLELGDNNVVREFCTLNRGTAQGPGVTRIGNDNLFMSYVHVAHDCQVGNHTIFANNASCAGHVTVKDYAILGGFCGIHQFCSIGEHSFVAKAAMVSKDVLPYVLVSGNVAKAYGLNMVGLKRHEFTEETINSLRDAYNIIFRNGLTVKDALPQLEEMLTYCKDVQLFIDGLNNASRGVVR